MAAAKVAVSNERWVVSPEVAGELGNDVELDSSVHPPKVYRFHQRFEGWLGDELLEAFPCFLVSSDLAKAIEEEGLVGFSLGDVEVSASPEFHALYPGRDLPEFRWLKITGIGSFQSGAEGPAEIQYRSCGDRPC